MSADATENPYADRRGRSRRPDVVMGFPFVRPEYVFFNSFQRTDKGDWFVTAERTRAWGFWDSATTFTTFVGSGIAWVERRGGKTFACPLKIYNELNTCISVITAGERNARH